MIRHGARTPFKLIPNIEQATWPLEDNEDLPHTLISHTVRSLDFGGKPESAIDNAYLDKEKLKVSPFKYHECWNIVLIVGLLKFGHCCMWAWSLTFILVLPRN